MGKKTRSTPRQASARATDMFAGLISGLRAAADLIESGEVIDGCQRALALVANHLTAEQAREMLSPAYAVDLAGPYRDAGLEPEDISLIGWTARAMAMHSCSDLAGEMFALPRAVRRRALALIEDLHGVNLAPHEQCRVVAVRDSIAAELRSAITAAGGPASLADAFVLTPYAWARAYVNGAAARQDAELARLGEQLHAVAMRDRDVLRAVSTLIRGAGDIRRGLIETITVKRGETP